MNKRIILGIDPGSVIMGFGIIQAEQRDNMPIRLITHGVLELKKHKTHMLRMSHIYRHIIELLQKYTPNEIAIESIFYGKNVQSMLKLGRAQGIAIAAALACNIPVTEYAPRKVKQSITGQGAASKAQVAAMVERLLGIATPSTLLDASDALAIAVCHCQQRLPIINKHQRWSQFVAENPARIQGNASLS